MHLSVQRTMEYLLSVAPVGHTDRSSCVSMLEQPPAYSPGQAESWTTLGLTTSLPQHIRDYLLLLLEVSKGCLNLGFHLDLAFDLLFILVRELRHATRYKDGARDCDPPTRICPGSRPNSDRSHRHTAMMTTTFMICLM